MTYLIFLQFPAFRTSIVFFSTLVPEVLVLKAGNWENVDASLRDITVEIFIGF